MKLPKHWPMYLLLLAVIAAGSRLAWVGSRTELGWELHLHQWSDVTRDLVGLDTTPLKESDPSIQAEYWLEEVEGVEETASDAMVAAGAAWVLDFAQQRFAHNYLRRIEHSGFEPSTGQSHLKLDYEAIGALNQQFESLCGEECLSQIDRAVQLDSGNPEAWRARALLQFRPGYRGSEYSPRSADWRSVLLECAEHDAENALYDYLAATYLWTVSSEYAWDTDAIRLLITNDELFAEGHERFAAGLEKPLLLFDTQSQINSFSFLNESSHPVGDQIQLVQSRLSAYRATEVLRNILNWQRAQYRQHVRDDNFQEASAVARNTIRVADQMWPPESGPDLQLWRLTLRRNGLVHLHHLQLEHSESLAEEDAFEVADAYLDARIDYKVLLDASEVISRNRTDKNSTKSHVGAFDLPADIYAMWIAIASSIALIVVSLALTLMSTPVARAWRAEPGELPTAIGRMGSFSAWICAFLFSYLLFGMFPAEIVSAGTQTLLLRVLIWILYASAVLGALLYCRRRFNVPWPQFFAVATAVALPIIFAHHLFGALTLIVQTVAWLHPAATCLILVAMAFACWLVIRLSMAMARNCSISDDHKVLALGSVLLLSLVAVPMRTLTDEIIRDHIRERVWIEPTLWKKADSLPIAPSSVRTAMKLDDSPWIWATIQWSAHRGHLVAMLMFVAVLCLLQFIHLARKNPNGWLDVLRRRKRWYVRCVALTISRTCRAAALVFLLMYLILTAPAATTLDEYYRFQRDWLMDVPLHRTQLDHALAVVRSDESVMNRIRAEIAAEDRERIAREKSTDTTWVDDSYEEQD